MTRLAPTDTLILHRSASGLALSADGLGRLIAAAPGIYAVILDPEAPGVRAVVPISWGDTPSTERRIWEILEMMQPSDTLFLVIQGEVERVELILDRLLSIRPKPGGEARSAVLVANLSVNPHWLQLMVNPESGRLTVDEWTKRVRPDAN